MSGGVALAGPRGRLSRNSHTSRGCFPWCVRSEITRVFSEMISQETMMLFSRAACVLAVCTFFATPLAAQSFNCRDAQKPDEVLICQNPQLAALDERMASMYFRLRNSLAGTPAASSKPIRRRGCRSGTAAGATLVASAACMSAASPNWPNTKPSRSPSSSSGGHDCRQYGVASPAENRGLWRPREFS
jgi:hypothetical protein